ncbi:hypothetical protein P154DRAFT_435578, partial [Amniculicola lignicola CBS 123094]
YSLATIKDTFKLTFNSFIKIFNPLQNNTKVVVTIITIIESSTYLFTNYNSRH